MSSDYQVLAAGELIARKYRMDRVLCVGTRSVLVLAEHATLRLWVVVQIFLRRDPQDMAWQEARLRALAGDPSPPPWARITDVGMLENGHGYAVFGHVTGVDYTPLITS